MIVVKINAISQKQVGEQVSTPDMVAQARLDKGYKVRDMRESMTEFMVTDSNSGKLLDVPAMAQQGEVRSPPTPWSHRSLAGSLWHKGTI